MSEQVIELAPRQRPRTPEEILKPIKERVEQARRDRRRYEPTVHSNRAFAAGKSWLKWSRADRQLRLDPRDVEGGLERTTANILTQYIQTAIGQLGGADERPNLQFTNDDIPSENFTEAANKALAFGWEQEWRAKDVLARTTRRIVTDGTAAIRVRFDPTVGRELGPTPIGDGRTLLLPPEEEGGEPEQVTVERGRPILDTRVARAYVAELQQSGQRAQFRDLREGRVIWEPLSFFTILTPPGIEDEADFTWEAVIRAVPLDKLRDLYGVEKVQGLEEEPLAALEMLGVRESMDTSLGGSEEDGGQPGKLDGHVALITYYERPCRDYPKGREVVFAGERLLETKDELPLTLPNGDRSSGLVYFHYWRVEGRFWGQAFVEPGKGLQRLYNKRLQQIQATIDRGQPFVWEPEGSEIQAPSQVMQRVRFQPTAMRPELAQGMGPGEWMWRSLEQLLSDLERALGIREIALGDNPSNVNSFAQLQRLEELNQTKTAPIVEDFQDGVVLATTFSVPLIRRYWPSDKMIALAGDEEMAEAVEFKASQLPEFFLCRVAENARPPSHAAQLQLIEDLWRADKETGEPQLTLQWKYDSIKAGKPLPLPERPADLQTEKARWQNAKLLDGEGCEAQEYDLAEIHIPIHREAQIEAEMAERPDLWALVQAHIDADTQMAAQLASETAAMQGAALGVAQTPPPAPPPVAQPAA